MEPGLKLVQFKSTAMTSRVPRFVAAGMLIRLEVQDLRLSEGFFVFSCPGVLGPLFTERPGTLRPKHKQNQHQRPASFATHDSLNLCSWGAFSEQYSQ